MYGIGNFLININQSPQIEAVLVIVLVISSLLSTVAFLTKARIAPSIKQVAIILAITLVFVLIINLGSILNTLQLKKLPCEIGCFPGTPCDCWEEVTLMDRGLMIYNNNLKVFFKFMVFLVLMQYSFVVLLPQIIKTKFWEKKKINQAPPV